MTPQEAMQLEAGDIVLFNAQFFVVSQMFRNGQLIHLRGKTQDQIVSPRRPVLVYRKDEVPADLQLGHLTTEQEARVMTMVAERKGDGHGAQ
jgi:hypothetical protein